MLKIKTIEIKRFALWRKYPNCSDLVNRLRRRIVFAMATTCSVFIGISWYLLSVMVISPYQKTLHTYKREKIAKKADVVDRNGELLATSITTSSCFADPSVVIDLEDTIKKLSNICGMPSTDKIRHKLSNKSKHFVWLMRHVHPTIEKKNYGYGITWYLFSKRLQTYIYTR